MKNYIITGCSRGLGLEMVTQLTNAGHKIYACVRNTKTEKLRIIQKKYPSLITIIPIDIRDELNSDEFFTHIEEKSFKIDILVNNAGIMLDSKMPMTSQHLLNAKKMMEVNYWGTINLTNFLLPYLKKSSHPLIINISSKMGSLELMKNGEDWGYRASKTALNMFTRCFSMNNPDMPIIALHPGHVQTNIGRINPPLTAEESVRFMVNTWSTFSKKKSGKFINYDGSELAW